MQTFKKSLMAVALLAAISSAHAHRQWMLPSASQVEGKEPWVTVDAAVSEDLFDIGANALKLDGLVITAPDGKVVAADQTSVGKQRASVDLKLTQTGTYRFVLASETAMASYKQNGETKRWRGNAADLKKEIPAGVEELTVTTTVGRLETYVTNDKPSRRSSSRQASGWS